MNKVERREDNFSEVVIESVSERIIRENKVSAFSRANEIKAVVPDFEKSSEVELEALGLQKEGIRWYVPNRKDFSDPLDESSVLIDWGFKKETGERDLGFCSKEEFEKIYVYSEKYKKNEIEYIDATKLEKNKVFSATKCATASFTILPIGTKIKSNEGEVASEKGRILMINEAKDSLYLIDIGDFLAKHIADPLNPVSKKTFELLANYEGSNKR